MSFTDFASLYFSTCRPFDTPYHSGSDNPVGAGRRLTPRMGSVGIAAWIAHVTFWVLLVYGWFWDALGSKALGVLIFLWLTGMLGLPFIAYGAALFPPFVAVLDIALVFMIFKGDVRL